MPKPPVAHPILTTRRLRLRQFRPEDAEAMHRCYADPEAMRFRSHPVHARRIETERAVRRYMSCTPSYYRFWAVAEATTDRCLGLVSYHDGHIRNRRAAIGYIIDPARHRQGFGAEAVSAMIDFCLGELGLHRLEAYVQPENVASLSLIEKLGFRREGLLRENLRVGDVWRSEWLYALLETDRAAAR